jgi:hypothetical protein
MTYTHEHGCTNDWAEVRPAGHQPSGSDPLGPEQN